MKHQYHDVAGRGGSDDPPARSTVCDPPAGLAVFLPAPPNVPEPGDAALMRSVIEQMDTMVVLVNGNSTIRLANPAVTRTLGFATDGVVGRSFLRYVSAPDRATILEAVASLTPGDSVALDANFTTSTGGSLVCQFTVTNLLHDESIRLFVVTGQPAPALADARARMAFLASHDQRTGLLNRDGFMVAAEQLVQHGDGLGLLLVDLVHFRSVNELYGEAVGDAVLQAIADRIEGLRWPGQVVARLGADEFVIAIQGPTRAPPSNSCANGCCAWSVDRSWRTGTRSTSRCAPRSGSTPARSRSTRCWRVRATICDGSNATPTPRPKRSPTMRSPNDDAEVDLLRNALTNGEIEPFFDPIVDHEGRIIALEALVRRVDPLPRRGRREQCAAAGADGRPDPRHRRSDADPVAGLLVRRLTDYGAGDIRIHINVDPSSIASTGFAQRLLSRSALLGVDHDQVVVELTENDLLAPSSVTLGNLHALRQAGISVAIDDFGTGYSSLAHLLEAPGRRGEDRRRFIAGIDVDLAATNLTKAIIGLCDSLDLRCIAESSRAAVPAAAAAQAIPELPRMVVRPGDAGRRCARQSRHVTPAALHGRRHTSSRPRSPVGRRRPQRRSGAPLTVAVRSRCHAPPRAAVADVPQHESARRRHLPRPGIDPRRQGRGDRRRRRGGRCPPRPGCRRCCAPSDGRTPWP